MTTASQPSIRQLARGFGVSQMAVQKAAKAGRLDGAVVRDAKGRLVVVDSGLAAQLWAKNRSQVSQGKGMAIEEPEEQPADDRAPQDDKPDSAWSMAEAKVRNDLASARLKEQQLKVRDGELIERVRAIKEADAAARVIRDALLTIPDRLASELAGEEDADVIHARLDAEIRQALQLAVAAAKESVGDDAA